jgi:hypothetical protein
MSPDYTTVKDGSAQQPSHSAIDYGNPATFKPKYLVLDDINIDLISVIVVFIGLVSACTSYTSSITAVLTVATIILPLQMIFPRPITPEGLVLITGGSSGIGAELAYVFAQRGHDLVLVGRNAKQLELVKLNVERKYKRDVHTIVSDLSLPGSAKQLYETITGKGLNISILVNNAGLGAAGETLEQPIEIVERMTVLNCITPVQLTQLFGRDMAQRGKGWMLQNSSVGGMLRVSVYTAIPIFPLETQVLITFLLRVDGISSSQHLPCD